MHICLLVPPSDPNQYSWGENYAGSSGLMSVSPDMNPMQRARSGTVSLQSHTRSHGRLSLVLHVHISLPCFLLTHRPRSTAVILSIFRHLLICNYHFFSFQSPPLHITLCLPNSLLQFPVSTSVWSLVRRLVSACVT